MADYFKEDFLQLVKRGGTFVSIKISSLLRALVSRPYGAIAGLAIAVIVTWRLKASTRKQRKQPKRHPPPTINSGVGSPKSENAANSIVTNLPEDRKAPNVLSPSQIVRQRLNEGRRVTCRLLGVILEETSPNELQEKATVRSSVLEVLLEISKFSDLYLMERVLDDESEKNVLAALEEMGVFTSGGLIRDKVLFCSTENGCASFVRQLEPNWHIDSDPAIVAQLARFVARQVYVSPMKLEQPASNVFMASSLEQFFGSV
ncbi:peroxisome biogenesis protein 22-like [Andrographis paniculata]|uniref:peroxisome biogenesis protein 22-like n=1 Tax=Andrographis paniculata TaxID=175694 RepID=UPI0021E86E22|nr:peroxisome biogenesis protein 22-like [Andrographis paniculata]